MASQCDNLLWGYFLFKVRKKLIIKYLKANITVSDTITAYLEKYLVYEHWQNQKY